ncbi:MAG: hypothetical protein HY799_09090 [Nitrosomonadales bacterium]|nr:hypothetical protein [Nitrosomonadales bacterium]
MRKVLLFPLLWVVFVASAQAEVDFGISDKPADATSAEGARIVPAASKWYAGFNVGFGRLAGWDMGPVDSYYRSIGYERWSQSYGDKALDEVKLYTANRVRGFLDVEFGYAYASNLGGDNWSKYSSGSNAVISTRRFTIHVLSLSALYRPTAGRLYFRGGLHASEIAIRKTVTGNPANLNVIAAGDRMYGDGVSQGFGTLVGFGFDFRTGKAGAIRVELNHHFRLGGTRYEKSAVDLGYHFNF